MRENSGVSPVIGVVLIIAVTVAVVSLVTLIAFNIGDDMSNPPESTPVDVQYQSESAISIQLLSEQENSVIVQSALGTEYQISEAGDSVTIPNQKGNKTPVALGQEDGDRAVLRRIPPEKPFNSDIVVNQGESVQSAVNDAQDGDIIVLERDTYEESLSISTNNITLVGEGGTVLDASSSPAVDVTGEDVWLSNIEVNGDGSGTGVNGRSDTTLVRSNVESVGTKLSGGVRELGGFQLVPNERIGSGNDGSSNDGETQPQLTKTTQYTYNNANLSVSSEEDDPHGMTFNDDGSKLYVVGSRNESVYEYDLTTPYDVSSASYSGKSLNVSGQDGDIQGLSFNDDGSKVYVLGGGNTRVYQYDLTTPYNMSSASYSGNSFYVGGQDSIPTGMDFNDDGSKLYVLGALNADVYEYNLTAPYDVSSASYNSGGELDVSGQEDSSSGLSFSDDGSKLYVVGIIGNAVYEYNLTAPYDVSSGSYSGNSLDVSGQDFSPESMSLNNDGSKIYIIGRISDRVYEYSNGQ